MLLDELSCCMELRDAIKMPGDFPLDIFRLRFRREVESMN